jgi:hypothetical protein
MGYNPEDRKMLREREAEIGIVVFDPSRRTPPPFDGNHSLETG